MNEIEQVTAGALAPSDYATYEIAKENDGVLGSLNISAIRAYGSAMRARAEGIRAFIANSNDTDDIATAKAEMNETAITYSRVSIFCDVRIGELLRELPKNNDFRGNQYKEVNSQIRELTKADALNEAGIKKTQAYELSRLSRHVDVVESVLNEAEEKGEIVSINKIMHAIYDKEHPNKQCRKCGVELTEENTTHKWSGHICKDCANEHQQEYRQECKNGASVNTVFQKWTVTMLIDELKMNAPVWRKTINDTFDIYAENGVIVSKTSINAINDIFDNLDAAIAAIVEG